MPINTGTAIRELKIGPYAGGINLYSDVSAIADDEMRDCVNFDIDLDGSLKSRPPWRLLFGTSVVDTTVSGSPPASRQLILLTGTYEDIRFIIIQSNHEMSGFANYIYYLDGPNAGTLAKIADGNSLVAVRYNNDVYLVPAQSSASVTGTGTKYVLDTGVVTNIPNMPRGDAAVIYKDRLWICSRDNKGFSSRLNFSELADFTSYPGTNFFDVNPGDGDNLNALIVYQDNLMLFKDSATYVLTYDTGPAQAVLQVINTDIGTFNPRCVVAYENSIFVLRYNQLFEIVNYDFTRVSVKLPFEYDDDTPSTVSGQGWQWQTWARQCGDRIVCRFYNRLYVYHLRLRAWTRWTSKDISIAGLGPIVQLDQTSSKNMQRLGRGQWVATSSYTKGSDPAGQGSSGAWNKYFKIFVMDDTYDTNYTENGALTPPSTPVDIECSMLTKMYDIGVSHRFKRLMHWGVDCISTRGVTGTVYPFSVFNKVTWEQLHTIQWHLLNTWEYPLTLIPSTTQTQPAGTGINRRFIRFPKSLRFRLTQFGIQMVTIGNSTDGPARLYSLTAFIGGKQLVPRAVN